jgi:hypothetical protein
VVKVERDRHARGGGDRSAGGRDRLDPSQVKVDRVLAHLQDDRCPGGLGAGRDRLRVLERDDVEGGNPDPTLPSGCNQVTGPVQGHRASWEPSATRSAGRT